MSVSSATDTFTDGAQLFDQDKYQSTVSISIEPDPIQMEKDFQKPLNQRFITLHSGNDVYAEYRLDDVQVRCPSDAFREYQSNQWFIRIAEAKNQSWIWTATTIGSSLVAIVGAIMMTVGPAELAIAPIFLVAGGVLAIVSLFFASQAHSVLNQANDQIQKWVADPLLKIYKERNFAHQEGFPYIYDNNLKLGNEPSTTALFHPKQVEHEYKKYFDLFCHLLLNELSHTNIIEWMQAFLYLNPLIRDRMIYGLGLIPDHMKPVIEDYARFESFLTSIKESYDNLSAEETANAKERIDAYKKTQAEELQPHADARDSAITAARTERDKEIIKAQRERENASIKIENQKSYIASSRCKTAVEAAEKAYALKAELINGKYDEKINGEKQKLKERLGKLEEQKRQQFANNCNAARELLIRAKQAWDNKGYQPVNFQQYFPYQAPQMGWYQQQPAYVPAQPFPQQQLVYAPQQPDLQQQPSYSPQQPVQQPVYAQQPPMAYTQPHYGQPAYPIHQPVYVQP